MLISAMVLKTENLKFELLRVFRRVRQNSNLVGPPEVLILDISWITGFLPLPRSVAPGCDGKGRGHAVRILWTRRSHWKGS